MRIKLTPSDRKILEAIREKVEATHWVKGTYRRVLKTGANAGKVQFCMVGFVNEVTLPENGMSESSCSSDASRIKYRYPEAKPQKLAQRSRLVGRLLQEIQEIYGYKYSSIQAFNDARDTKRKDVLEIFDRALGKKA